MKAAYIIFLILFLELLPIAFGADISISKKLSTNSIKYKSGEAVGVNIEIVNNGNEQIEGLLVDGFPRYAEVLDKEIDESSFTPAVSWNISLNAGESKNFSYRLKLDGAPLSPEGHLNVTLFPAVLTIGSEKYESNSAWVYVSNIPEPQEKCNYNFKCEPSLGENSSTCPQDCLTTKTTTTTTSKKITGTWLYVSISIAAISVVALLILLKFRPKPQSYPNLYQKWSR